MDRAGSVTIQKLTLTTMGTRLAAVVEHPYRILGAFIYVSPIAAFIFIMHVKTSLKIIHDG